MVYAWLQIQKADNRQDVKRLRETGIHADELVLLSFEKGMAENLLSWEDAHEFEYEGQMYDVVKSEVVGDTIHYWCWHDHRETRINDHLAGLIQKTIPARQGQDRPARALKLLITPYCLARTQWNAEHAAQEIPLPGHQPALYLSFSKDPPSPPPRMS